MKDKYDKYDRQLGERKQKHLERKYIKQSRRKTSEVERTFKASAMEVLLK